VLAAEFQIMLVLWGNRRILAAPFRVRTLSRKRMSIKVEVKSNESLEAALRRFKRQCNYGGIFRLAKANTWHEKRSDKRRRERRERMRTILKAARRARARLRHG
jgi:small subunit ribosomal protein S21